MFEVTSAWSSTYPEAYAGVLVMRSVSNPAHDPALESRKAALQEQLRAQFSGQDRAAIASHPVLRAYAEYYRQFKKTYHIQLQLESIVLKGKSIPRVAALVEAMFMAEMKDMLLTAGHDWTHCTCLSHWVLRQGLKGIPYCVARSRSLNLAI